ncbi:MAG: cation transporter [Oscillospiraceae bacterium]|nr:cation transporter [Oscillospiraceae bacterium]
MKTEKNILIAFVLNLAFSIFELIGGFVTGSVAIASDALHDLGDAASIGLSFFFERKSRKAPDESYTYGYARYSVVGSVITTLILLCGSLAVIYNSINRMINPAEINYDGMIVFALFGVAVNFAAAYFTREGDSLNQKAVNLHMLEDVLGWAVVLIGAVVMRFTNLKIIDPLMSVAVAVFIIINAAKNLKEALDVFLEKTPFGVSVTEIREHLSELPGVVDVHHIHLWSADGQNIFATMHVVTNSEPIEIKEKIRKELLSHGVAHVTLELETEGEQCSEKTCHIEREETCGHHHHHHH